MKIAHHLLVLLCAVVLVTTTLWADNAKNVSAPTNVPVKVSATSPDLAKTQTTPLKQTASFGFIIKTYIRFYFGLPLIEVRPQTGIEPLKSSTGIPTKRGIDTTMRDHGGSSEDF